MTYNVFAGTLNLNRYQPHPFRSTHVISYGLSLHSAAVRCKQKARVCSAS